MITRTTWALALLFLLQGHRADAQTAMECKGRRFSGSQLLSAELSRCTDVGLGRGLAIDVGPATYAYTDNPECPQGETDRIAREIARVGSDRRPRLDWVADFTAFWTAFQRRTSSFGNDFEALAQGKLVGKSAARCQVFVIPVDVPANAITRIEFQAAQGGKIGTCFQIATRQAIEGRQQSAFKTSGTCELGWSGWQSVLVVDDKFGTVVAAVFKNWSHNLMRTGVLWVWD